MYVVSKTINNNVVLVNDSMFREFIVIGNGIGFGKKVGEFVEIEKIEKVYSLHNGETDYLLEYLKSVDYQLLSVCDSIKEHVECELGVEYNSYMFFSLVDHIHNTLYRSENRIVIESDLSLIKLKIYNRELKLAKEVSEIIAEKLDKELNDTEVNFLALHFIIFFEEHSISSESDERLEVIDAVLHYIESVANLSFESEFTKRRFVMHLKNFLLRHESKTDERELSDTDLSMYVLMREKYKVASDLLEDILDILHKYNIDVMGQERLYLLIHLVKVSRN